MPMHSEETRHYQQQSFAPPAALHPSEQEHHSMRDLAMTQSLQRFDSDFSNPYAPEQQQQQQQQQQPSLESSHLMQQSHHHHVMQHPFHSSSGAPASSEDLDGEWPRQSHRPQDSSFMGGDLLVPGLLSPSFGSTPASNGVAGSNDPMLSCMLSDAAASTHLPDAVDDMMSFAVDAHTP